MEMKGSREWGLAPIALTIKGALVSSTHAKITIDHLHGPLHLAYAS